MPACSKIQNLRIGYDILGFSFISSVGLMFAGIEAPSDLSCAKHRLLSMVDWQRVVDASRSLYNLHKLSCFRLAFK